MISSRVALSRDHYAAGVVTIAGGAGIAVFTPFTGPPPSGLPPSLYGAPVPTDAVPCIYADRILVSNPGAAVVLRPVIPGSPEATPYPYPKYANALGGAGYDADWTAFSPSGFAAAPSSGANGITVPAGAVGFPIEVVCIGLVIAGTTGNTLAWAAYGSNKRA